MFLSTQKIDVVYDYVHVCIMNDDIWVFSEWGLYEFRENQMTRYILIFRIDVMHVPLFVWSKDNSR